MVCCLPTKVPCDHGKTAPKITSKITSNASNAGTAPSVPTGTDPVHVDFDRGVMELAKELVMAKQSKASSRRPARKASTAPARARRKGAAKRAAKRAAKGAAKGAAKRASNKRAPNRWSQRVTTESDALDLKSGVFKQTSAKKIAVSLKASAEASRRRKAGAYRSALSMLTFYINRAGRNLPKPQRARLERAKVELKHLFGRE